MITVCIKAYPLANSVKSCAMGRFSSEGLSDRRYSVTEGTQFVGDLSHEQFTSDVYNKNRDLLLQ